MTAVVFSVAPDGRHTVRFQFDPTVVSLIKQTVPAYARSWSPHVRCWHVDADWAALLADELRRHGHTVTDADQRTNPGGDWARQLFDAVGPHRAPSVHRALTKVLHPDNADTGCPILQRELNDARRALTGVG